MKVTNAQRYSILITDDDRSCRQALQDIMEPEGFRTVLASSGEEALDIIRDDLVHLALLDMHMPRLTGLETLQLVHQVNAMLPCILVTGDANERLIRLACQLHAYSVIPKPVNKHVVLYTVVRALGRFYESRQNERTTPNPAPQPEKEH
jgi:DNA-binding NtrC family response regulator